MPSLPSETVPPPSSGPMGPNMAPAQAPEPYPTQNSYAPPVEPAPAPIDAPPSMGNPQGAPLSEPQPQSPGPPPSDSQPAFNWRSTSGSDRPADMGRSPQAPAARSFNQDIPYRPDGSVGSVRLIPQTGPVDKPASHTSTATEGTRWNMSNRNPGRVRPWNWRAGGGQAAKTVPVDEVPRAVEAESDPDRPGRVLLK